MLEIAPVPKQQIYEQTLADLIKRHEPESLDPGIYAYEPDQYSVGTLEYFENLSKRGYTLLSEEEQHIYKTEAIAESEYFIAHFVATTTLQLFQNFRHQASAKERFFSLEDRIKDKRIRKSFYRDFYTLKHNLGHRSEPYQKEIIQNGKEKGITYLLEYLTPPDSPMLKRYSWTDASKFMNLTYDETKSEWFGQMETNIRGVFLESVYMEGYDNPHLLLIISPEKSNEN